MKKVQLVRPARSVASFSVSHARKVAGTGVGVSTPPMEGVHTPLYPAGGPRGKAEHRDDDVGNVASLVARLTAEQRKELLARLALEQSSAAADQPRDIDMWSEAVYQAINSLGRDSVMAGSGPAVVKRTVGTPQMWRPVADFMATSRLDSLTVTERQSVYGMLARLVISHAHNVARRASVPLSLKLVGNCANNIAGLFDNAFPGYLDSGLALIVARRLTAGPVAA